MNKHHKQIERRPLVDKLPNASGDNAKAVLTTEVYYSLGGMSFFTGQSKKRGYYLSVTPQSIGDGFVSTLAFSGVCDLIEEAPRFNAKRLAELHSMGRNLPKYQQMTELILAKIGLPLLSETPTGELAELVNT